MSYFEELYSFISISTDGWASDYLNSYLSSTYHYIDQNWLLQKRVLSLRYTSESKTSEFLNRKLKEIFEEFKIYESIFGISCDSGANINKAVGEFSNFVRVPCAGHRFNLCANDLFKETIIKNKFNAQGYYLF